MRRTSLILIALMLFSASCTRKPKQSLVGEWEGTDSTGQSGYLVLNRDRTFKMIMGNVVSDGQWQADTSRDPMTLDFVIKSPSGQQVLPMIFRFITDHKIQIRMGEDAKSRPTNFSTDDTVNQMVLTKK
jgi:hypothetical protein